MHQQNTHFYNTPLTEQQLTPVEDDLLAFIRTGNLPEEPLSWPEIREKQISEGATVAELDAEIEQYREAMRELRVKLASFLLATEHLGVPIATVTATITTVRVKHALPEAV